MVISDTTRRLLVLAVALIATLLGGPPRDPADARPPNIVVIFTDDQGYSDVGCFGANGFETPNIDRLAREGMRFTDFYVAQPVCSASRAALLTGCYPNRIGITGALGPNSRIGLHPGETTLAEICREKGYATAIFGKWHLGSERPFLPLQHGFDEFYGIPYSNDMWPWHPSVAHLPDVDQKRKEGYPDLPLFEGNEIVIAEVTPARQKQFTKSFTERAVAFINENKERPFFLYVPHPMPHVPLFTSESFAGVSGQGAYGDVICEIDWSVGEIMRALDENNLADNTLIIFATDNGPWLNYGNHAGSARPLREGKGTTFEGGVRVPCIMRWPGRIPAESACSEPVMTIDILPTIAKLIGADLPARTIDGESIAALMLGKHGAASPHQALFFYYHRNDLESMRMGTWKLHFPHTYRSIVGQTPGKGGTPGPYNWNAAIALELFDLEYDVGETANVADQHPEVVAKMQELADAMRIQLGDDLTKRAATAARSSGGAE